MLRENDDGQVAAEIQWRIPKWFPHLKESTIAQLKKYHEELLKFNMKVNLISVRTIVDADEIHFADSIWASELILKDMERNEIVDIGSGNGFPGIILGILDPKKTVILLDCDTRKLEFMKYIRDTLHLENIKILKGRLEEFQEGVLKVGMARGFAPLGKALLSARRPFVKNGVFYNLKGSEWTVELTALPHQICALWKTNLVGGYTLAESKAERAVLKSVKY